MHTDVISSSLVFGVEVCFGGGRVGLDGQYLGVLGRAGRSAGLPVLVVPVLAQQGDAGQQDADENDDEHTACGHGSRSASGVNEAARGSVERRGR